MNGFGDYLPDGSLEKIKPWFEKYTIKLTITKARKTILGNYLHPHPGHPHHAITINGNQNPFSFLITLLHEFAHLEAYVQFKNKISPHGSEWQTIYRAILLEYIGKGFFPAELEIAVAKSLNQVKASSCADPILFKALAAYDKDSVDDLNWVEELKPQSYFITKEGLAYRLIEKRRTRYLCEHLASRKKYLFSGVARVKTISEEELVSKGFKV